MSQRPDLHGPTYSLPTPAPPDPTGWIKLRASARDLLWPPRPAAWAWIFAVAVAVAGLHGLWFQATLSGRLPSPGDWRAVSAVLASEARPGDAVALAPAWAERAREVLPSRFPSWPQARLPILALPSYAEADEDLAGVRRVWLVSLPDVPGGRGSAAAQLARRSTRPDPPQRIGQLELARFDLRTPLLPLWSLADRPVAPGQDATLRREIREVGFLPRDCLVARFPGPAPAPLVLRLDDPPLGAALRGHVGLVGYPAREAPPVTVRLRVDGVERARAEASAATPAWRAFQAETASIPPGHHTVEIEIAPSGPLPEGACVELLALP